jgi:hypothetical protein
MPRNKRVFPFFLDGGVQEVSYGASDTTDAWDGTSSYVEILSAATATPTFTIGVTDSYGRPVDHGTLLVVRNVQSGAETVTVDWSDEFTDGSQGQSVDLIQEGSGVMLLFKGPSSSNKKGEWVNLTSDTDKTEQSANLDILGDLHVKGALKLSSTTVQAAAGSDATGATAISAIKPVVFVSSAAGTEGVKITEYVDDAVVRVVNTGGNAVFIYPDGSDRTTIDGGSSYELPANGAAELYFPSLTGQDTKIYLLNSQA